MTIWDFIGVVLIVAIIQPFTHWMLNKITNKVEKRKNNRMCKLYIDDDYKGEYTFEECKNIYELQQYIHRKSSGFDKKEKTFHILIDEEQ